MVALVFCVQWLVSTEVPKHRFQLNWIQRNYVMLIIITACTLAVMALTLYLVEIGVSLTKIVDRLEADASNPDTPALDIRNIATSVALLMGVLAAAATVFFSVIRVWINERTAKATEEGLINDLIFKAVQGLSADKPVRKLIETPVYVTDKNGETIYDDQGPLELTDPLGKAVIERTTYEFTDVNIEARIGAIFSLQRLSKDSIQDHITILRILSSYVRQNTQTPVGPSVDLPPLGYRNKDQGVFLVDLDIRRTRLGRFGRAFFEGQAWLAARNLRTRADIEIAIQVLGTRTSALRVHEQNAKEFGQSGFKIDLRGCYLGGCNFNDMKLGGAVLSESNLDGISGASLIFQSILGQKMSARGASFVNCDFEGSTLTEADFEGSSFVRCNFANANLTGTRFDGAKLEDCNLQDTALSHAQFEAAAVYRCDFSNAEGDNVNMCGTDLFNSSFQNSIFEDSFFDFSTNFQGTNWLGSVMLNPMHPDTKSYPPSHFKGAYVR
jgi:uncharacterized protein YjbI with pentapeptide repeats